MRLAAALLLAMTFTAQVVPVLPAGAAGGFRGPPANGDWVIQGTESYGSQDIHLKGNLVVSGSGFLELSDVNLYLDCTSDGQYGVFVQDGGTLSLKKDTIVTRGLGCNYTFAVTNGSRLWVNASAVHYCTPGMVLDHSNLNATDALIDLATTYSLQLNGSHVELLSTMLDYQKLIFKDDLSQVNVTWNIGFETRFLDGALASDVDVSIRNSSGALRFQGTTDANGTSSTVLREFQQTRNGITKDSPYTIATVWGGISHNASSLTVDKSMTVALYVDRSAPAIAFTQPRPPVVNSTSVLFSGTTSDDTRVVAVELSRDGGGTWTTATDAGLFPWWSAWNCTLHLDEGTREVVARANNTAGLESRAYLNVTVDITPPFIRIFSPSPDCATNLASIDIIGATEDGAGVTANGLPATVASGRFNVTVPLRGGWNLIGLEATDLAGNRNQTSLSVIRDLSPPGLKVFSPPEGFLTNQSSIRVIGLSDPDAAVRVGTNPNPVPLDPLGNFNVSVPLVSGSNAIEVRARDAAGNEALVTITGVLDFSAPFLDALAAVTLTNQSTVRVFGETEPGSVVSVAGVELALGEFGNFSAIVELSPGNNPIAVSSHDQAGNYNLAIVEVIRDIVAPEVNITKPLDAQVVSVAELEVCGTASDQNGIAGIEVGLDDQNYSFASGTTAWRGRVTLTAGNHTVNVLAYDRAGNSRRTSRLVSFVPPVTDRTPPTVTLRTPAAPEVSVRQVELKGAVSDPAGVSSVEISQDNRTWRSCALASSRDEWSVVVLLRTGENTIWIRAWDTAGNNATISVALTYSPPPGPAPPGYGIYVIGVLLSLGVIGSVLVVVNIWRRWTDQPEPGLGEDEAVIRFPAKGLK